MPPSNYSQEERKDSLYYRWEKLFALHIYLFRKPVLGICVALLFAIQIVSNVLGFECEVHVSDREAWIWKPYKNVPFYRAYLEWERVN